MEEYRKHLGSGDSVIVKLSEIESKYAAPLRVPAYLIRQS